MVVEALVADIEKLGGVVRTGVRVSEIAQSAASWTVRAEGRALADSDADAESATEALEFSADGVVLGTSEAMARRLLENIAPALAETTAADSPEIEIVTLLLRASALQGAPRGTGVLTVPGSHTAKALTHSTAKWEWLRAAAGDRHLVRVCFGAQGEPAATAGLDDATAQLALREASALLGVPLAPGDLIGAHRSRFVQSQPASIIGSGERRGGSARPSGPFPASRRWVRGSPAPDLAQVIPDAREEADRLRRSLIWD